MDQFLADYYGTMGDQAQNAPEDELEKMAQLTLLSKQAADEGIDLSEFSEEEILAAAQELYGQGEGAGEEDLEKEASEMFETFDYGGRVMAHALWQELGAIQKEAGARDLARRALGSVKRTALRGHRKVQDFGTRITEGPEGTNIARRGEWLNKKLSPKNRKRLATAVGYGVPAAGVGAVGGGTLALKGKGKKEKKSADSAYEEVVAQRMYEHLQAAGYDADSFFGSSQEKTAADEFEATVDQDALQRLEAAGVPVEWFDQE